MCLDGLFTGLVTAGEPATSVFLELGLPLGNTQSELALDTLLCSLHCTEVVLHCSVCSVQFAVFSLLCKVVKCVLCSVKCAV